MRGEWKFPQVAEAPVEIIDGDRGSNYPKQDDFGSSGHCLFLNTGNVTLTGFNFSDCAFVTKEKDETLRKGKLKRCDVVLTTRGTVGNVAFYDAFVPFEHIRLNSGMVILRANQEELLPRYLYLFLRSQNFKDQVASLTTGSAQPQLPIRDIRKVEIPLPPLSEQRAIAAVFGSLDDKIELNRRMNETLEALAQSLFKSWFVDATQSALPKGWRESIVGAELTTLLGGTPSRAKATFWEGGTIPWINSGKANEFRIIEPSEFITKAGFENSSTKLLPERTTIIAITGATLGQVSLLEIEACANQSVVGVLGSKQLPNEFVYFWVKENIDTLVSWQTGGAQQHINKDNVNELKIVCPPEDVIRAYTDAVRPIFNLIKSNCFESRTLAALRDALLPKLLSGELRVPAAAKLTEARA